MSTAHNTPAIERRHHAFHVCKDGTWIDVATGQLYDGPYKKMVDLSAVDSTEWQPDPPPPLPKAWALFDKLVMRPLVWLAGAFISAVLLAACVTWAFRSFAPEWLKWMAS